MGRVPGPDATQHLGVPRDVVRLAGIYVPFVGHPEVLGRIRAWYATHGMF